MNNHFYLETLPPNTAQLITLFQKEKPSFVKDFYLSGGTALSLQLGHRESEDLDFFNQNSFDPIRLQPILEQFGNLSDLELSAGTLNTFLGGVKLQFLEYPYPLLEPTVDLGGIQLSSAIDIACTKLQTVAMRGSKKDFIDVYFLLELFTFDELFEKLQKKYNQTDFSLTHILKSLIYFADADNQPLPRMHREVSWEEVKRKITEKTLAFKL